MGSPREDAGKDVADAVEAPGLEAACTPTLEDLPQEYRDVALQAAPCFSGYLDFPSGDIAVVPKLPAEPCNSVFGCYDCRWPKTDAEEEWAEQVKDAVRQLPYPCLPPNLHHFWVMGDAATQVTQIWSALVQCGAPGPAPGYHYAITLDEAGAVVETFGPSEATTSCVLAALEGVTFPCLAGLELCQGSPLAPDP